MQDQSGTPEDAAAGARRSGGSASARREPYGLEIDRCVCFELKFSEIQSQLGGRPTTLDGIARRFGCGSSCGTCRPYLARMLRTGETVFHEIITDES